VKKKKFQSSLEKETVEISTVTGWFGDYKYMFNPHVHRNVDRPLSSTAQLYALTK